MRSKVKKVTVRENRYWGTSVAVSEAMTRLALKQNVKVKLILLKRGTRDTEKTIRSLLRKVASTDRFTIEYRNQRT